MDDDISDQLEVELTSEVLTAFAGPVHILGVPEASFVLNLVGAVVLYFASDLLELALLVGVTAHFILAGVFLREPDFEILLEARSTASRWNPFGTRTKNNLREPPHNGELYLG